MRLFDDLIAAIRRLFIAPVDEPDRGIIEGPALTREVVRAKLAELATHRGGNLDTKSIVDVQKLLGKPSDMQFRGELWRKFEQPGVYTGAGWQNEKLMDCVIDAVVDGDVTIPKT